MEDLRIIALALPVFANFNVCVDQESSSERFDKDKLSLTLAGDFNSSTFTMSFASFVYLSRLGVLLKLHAEYLLYDKLAAKSGLYFITKEAVTRLSNVESTFIQSYLEVLFQLMYHIAYFKLRNRSFLFGIPYYL